jgi:hypothetical protein
MSRSVWAAVSPKRLRLVFHRFGSYVPLMPIVKVSISSSHPGRNPASRFLCCFCSGVYFAVLYASVSWRESAHWLFGLVNSKMRRCRLSQLTAQALGRLRRNAASSSTASPSPPRCMSSISSQARHALIRFSGCGRPRRPSMVHPLETSFMPFHSRCAMLWWTRILASLRAGQRHCQWM